MAKAKYALDKDKNKVYVIGHTKAVYDPNGQVLEDRLQNMATDIDTKANLTDIETALTDKLDTDGNASDTTIEFTQADTRVNLTAGEKLSIALGKIMKWFSDLKAVAFSGSYNDLNDKPTIPNKTSDLTNDSGFKTTDSNTTYSLSKSGSTITLTGSDGSTTSVTDSNTTYGVATTSANGLMSSSDKTKLDGIETGANKTVIDTALSSTSTNPVQNKVIRSALDAKASMAVLPNIRKSPYYDQYDYYESEKTEYEGYSYYDGCGIFMGDHPSFYDGDDMDKPTNVIILGVNHHISGMRNILVAGTGLKRAVSDSVACGRYNTNTSDTAYLVIGKGTSDSNRSNAFRVDYSGKGYFAVSVSGTGADYAEQWEWQDGNPNSEDRVGLFVAFQGDKIRLANETDNLRKVGIVSARPAVIGDDYDDEWQGKYLTDIFGRYLTETIEEDGKTREVFILNPDYDPEQEYVPREQRPEFDKVGTHGKLVVIDDGTCEVDGFCRPTSGGIATASEDGFYVMERIDDTHIRVYIK